MVGQSLVGHLAHFFRNVIKIIAPFLILSILFSGIFSLRWSFHFSILFSSLFFCFAFGMYSIQVQCTKIVYQNVYMYIMAVVLPFNVTLKIKSKMTWIFKICCIESNCCVYECMNLNRIFGCAWLYLHNFCLNSIKYILYISECLYVNM